MNTRPSYLDAGGAAHTIPLVASWPSKALGDLQLAERELARGRVVNGDAVCYHAQQAAEKLIKAALVARGMVDPPKVHDLVHLSAVLQSLLPAWSWDVNELSTPSSAAVEVRYPGYTATFEDARQSLEVSVRVWIALRPLI